MAGYFPLEPLGAPHPPKVEQEKKEKTEKEGKAKAASSPVAASIASLSKTFARGEHEVRKIQRNVHIMEKIDSGKAIEGFEIVIRELAACLEPLQKHSPDKYERLMKGFRKIMDNVKGIEPAFASEIQLRRLVENRDALVDLIGATLTDKEIKDFKLANIGDIPNVLGLFHLWNKHLEYSSSVERIVKRIDQLTKAETPADANKSIDKRVQIGLKNAEDAIKLLESLPVEKRELYFHKIMAGCAKLSWKIYHSTTENKFILGVIKLALMHPQYLESTNLRKVREMLEFSNSDLAPFYYKFEEVMQALPGSLNKFYTFYLRNDLHFQLHNSPRGPVRWDPNSTIKLAEKAFKSREASDYVVTKIANLCVSTATIPDFNQFLKIARNIELAPEGASLRPYQIELIQKTTYRILEDPDFLEKLDLINELINKLPLDEAKDPLSILLLKCATMIKKPGSEKLAFDGVKTVLETALNRGLVRFPQEAWDALKGKWERFNIDSKIFILLQYYSAKPRDTEKPSVETQQASKIREQLYKNMVLAPLELRGAQGGLTAGKDLIALGRECTKWDPELTADLARINAILEAETKKKSEPAAKEEGPKT